MSGTSTADSHQGDGSVSFVPRLCENSDVELPRRKFVSITLNKKRTALAVTVERRKERKQFCAVSARARFHTAWTHFRHRRSLQIYLFRPARRLPSVGYRPLHCRILIARGLECDD